MPIMADLARLYWIRDLHRQGHDWVLWLDADTLVVDPGWFPQLVGHTQFGEECWIQRRTSGQLETRYQPHNAYILMHRTSPVRDFLIYAVESILHRVDATKLAPQLVGPKLLKALSNLVAFPLEPAAGAMSPILQYALAARDEPEVLDQWPQGRPLALANLCASLDVPAATRAALIAEPQIISERLMNML